MAHILVIEANADIRNELQELLLYEGFQCYCAENGKTAWQILREKKPDLILSAIQIPDINGLEWLKRLRQHHEYCLKPFIFLSGLAAQDQIRAAMNLGANDYLIKPVSSHDLMAAIRAKLAHAQEIETFLNSDRKPFHNDLLHHFSHEIFTPLHALMGSSQILKKKYATLSPPKLLQLAELLQRNTSRLNHLLQNQMLYLELGNQPFMLQNAEKKHLLTHLNVTYLLNSITKERALFYQREADLQLQLESGSVRMLDNHFQVIVRELSDNAFKFSKPGNPVIVSSRHKDGFLQFKILNTGSGMSEEQLRQIQAYTQFGRKQQEQQGIGLGLALARDLLALYQAELTIESQANRYTQIMFRLPIAED